jgi:arginase family enzyme
MFLRADVQDPIDMTTVHLIGAPLDLGGERRGVDMGPSALRIAGLADRLAQLGITVVDKGDIPTPIPESKRPADPRKKYAREIGRVCQRRSDVSLDLDACDPAIAPGVGTPVKGGSDYRETHMIMEMVADSGRLMALDLVEVNPTLDLRNMTAEFAVELALSAVGQQIL